MAQSDRTFTIYTSTSNPRKSLKHPTQIALTVTPRNQSELFVTQTPLAWKVLEFTAQSDTQHIITWHSDPAFAVSSRGEQSTHVAIGNSGVLRNMGPGVVWNTVPGRRGVVMARNETRMPQVFSLGSVDNEDEFEGFLRFVSTSPNGAISIEPAVMLQAYTVTGYTPGKPLSQVDQNSYIFRKYDGSPLPLDLTTLVNDSSLLLSSEPSGRLALE